MSRKAGLLLFDGTSIVINSGLRTCTVILVQLGEELIGLCSNTWAGVVTEWWVSATPIGAESHSLNLWSLGNQAPTGV